jgi:uncharacterized membrane protein
MYKFAHLFDVVLSIYFVTFARIIIFWASSSSFYATVGGKINKCKDFISTRCNAWAYLLVI